MANTPLPTYWPKIGGKVAPEVEQTIRLLYNGVNDHETALGLLYTQVQALTPSTATTAATTASSTTSSTSTTLGGVNNQTGTTYTLQATDDGGIVTFNNAAAVAVTLLSSLSAGYFGSLANLGAGLVTLTPSSGQVNGVSSIQLSQNQSCFLYFDGVNWWAATSPQVALTFAAVSHRFLTSYTASTGLFTAGQPAFTDISGQIATAQLPSAGLSATIVTAKLTTGGSNGSMTFTNGILTASTPAT